MTYQVIPPKYTCKECDYKDKCKGTESFWQKRYYQSRWSISRRMFTQFNYWQFEQLKFARWSRCITFLQFSNCCFEKQSEGMHSNLLYYLYRFSVWFCTDLAKKFDIVSISYAKSNATKCKVNRMRHKLKTKWSDDTTTTCCQQDIIV